jgi:ankyrin repeat protein
VLFDRNTIQVLLDLGIDVNTLDKCDPDGNINTPLHVAMGNDWTRNNIKIAVILIKCGANVNARDHYGRTPLHYSIMANNCQDAMVFLIREWSRN